MMHAWDLPAADAVALQEELAARVVRAPLTGAVEWIAGVDCAFPDAHTIVAAAVLCDARTMAVEGVVSLVRPCRFPYIPGLLSFREAPAVIEAVKQLAERYGRPDLLMCDGQGIAHPRGLGIASHVGLWLDMPSIGVAKSRLCGKHTEPGLKRGCRRRLTYKGSVIGAVLRTRDAIKPLYVSVGHRVEFDDTIRWVLRAGRGVRLPEPVRHADRLAGVAKRNVLSP